MNKIENLFESGNFDSKNITNKSTVVIDNNILNDIERDGITLEALNMLKVPVFKYKTQITIHGLFPVLQNSYIGGYKNLFQNKNLSIGVRWQAVDFEKKKAIYKTVKAYLPGWSIAHNSTEFYIYKTGKYLKSKTEYTDELAAEKEYLNTINKSLFYGNTGVYLAAVWGSYFLVTYINIGAILDANTIKCIENLCNSDIVTIHDKIKSDSEAYEKEQQVRDNEYKLKTQRNQAIAAPLIQAGKEYLLNAGYQFCESVKLCTDMVFIQPTANIENNTTVFQITKFTKTKQQRKFRYQQITIKELTDVHLVSDAYLQETIKERFSGYMVTVKHNTPPPPKTPVKQPVNDKLQASVSVIDYSDRAVAVVGDTKPIKDILKAAGGRFNMHLRCGAGWVFPAGRKQELVNMLF